MKAVIRRPLGVQNQIELLFSFASSSMLRSERYMVYIYMGPSSEAVISFEAQIGFTREHLTYHLKSFFASMLCSEAIPALPGSRVLFSGTHRMNALEGTLPVASHRLVVTRYSVDSFSFTENAEGFTISRKPRSHKTSKAREQVARERPRADAKVLADIASFPLLEPL